MVAAKQTHQWNLESVQRKVGAKQRVLKELNNNSNIAIMIRNTRRKSQHYGFHSSEMTTLRNMA